MDVRHLTVFVTVAHERSFTRAAERMLLAQSAVSTTVRELERELGVELFDRSHRQIRLTDAGAELLVRAEDVLDRMRGLSEAVADAQRGLRGIVTMGVMTGVDLVDVPSLLGAYHARHPEVVVQLRAAGLGSAGLVSQLERGEIDLALLAVVEPLPATLTGRVVASSPFVLVVPEGHPLAGRERVSLAQLEGESFVDLPLGYGSRRIADDAFARAGVGRRVLIEVAEIATAPQYVVQGLGLALVPRFAASGPGIVQVEVAEELPAFEVSLAFAGRRPLPPAVSALVDLLRGELLP